MSANDQGMIGLIGLLLFVILILQVVKNRLRMRAERLAERAEDYRFQQRVEREVALRKKRVNFLNSLSEALSMVERDLVEKEAAKKSEESRLPVRTSCINCGAPYEDGAFCGYCGTRKEI